MSTSKKYFFIPVCLLRDLAVNRVEAIDNIFYYGIYHFAMTANFDEYTLISKFVYAALRKKDTIPINIVSKIEEINHEFFLLDEFAFNSSGDFEPEEVISDFLYGIFEKDSTLKNDVLEFAKVSASLDFYCITSNIDKIIKLGRYVDNNVSDGYPRTNIRRDKLFEFYTNDKSERELIKYAVYLSILSIVGKSKTPKLTNKKMVFARAFGYRNHKEICELETKPKLYEKYTTETVSRNILNEVEDDWPLHAYRRKGMRGMYVAKSNLIDRAALIEQVLAKRSSKKSRRSKDEEYEKLALQKLNLK